MHVEPKSDKCAPTHPQEGTLKIRIEGPDTSSLGPIIPLSNKARRSRVAAPKSLLFLLAVQPASPRGCLRSPHTVPLASLLSINRIIDK